MKSAMKKILAVTLCLSMLLCGFSAVAYGATASDSDTITLSKTIDLNSTKDLKGTGYYWDASTRTLTLTNANLAAEGRPVFKLNKSYDTKIVLVGDSTLTCTSAAAISNGGSSNGGKLTITGSGSLTINGYMYVNSTDITIAGCTLTVVPTSGVGIYRSLTNSGDGDLIITGGACVTLGDGLSLTSSESSLVLNGSYLTATSTYFGSAVEAGEDIIVKNGGQLTVANLYDVEDSSISDVIARFNSGVSAGGSIYFEEASLINISSIMGVGVKVENGDLKMASQELYVYGGLQAVKVTKAEMSATITMPEDSNWSYTAVTTTDKDGEVYCTTLTTNETAQISYDYVTDRLSGGNLELSYVSPEVERAESLLEEVLLEVNAKAYAKTSTKKSRIKIWWSQTDEDSIQVSGYQVARATKKSGTYKVVRTTAKESYLNTASLTKGKTYYYKVRPYIQVNDTLYYGEWSDVISATAK